MNSLNRDHTTNFQSQGLRCIGPTNVLLNGIPCISYYQIFQKYLINTNMFVFKNLNDTISSCDE